MKLQIRQMVAALTGLLCFSPTLLFAAEHSSKQSLDLTGHTVGYLSLAIFGFAYLLVTVSWTTFQ